MTPFDARYLAGLFDGEGCVSVSVGHRTRPQILVQLGVVQPEISETLKHQFGGHICFRKAHKNTRASYVWKANGHAGRRLLLAIYPWLRIKKAVATEAINYMVLRAQPYHIRREIKKPLRPEIAASQDIIVANIKNLNRRGRVR